ncbi:hypothetical protein GCM10007315_31770 [Gemmobacter tilapiae]|uniref:Uncharacterized protein n=1 Tax=Neogemmobacter tilapiae TaxID=875041 RepID=A0A918TW69_9RHOB|nr:hypothetical protein GCM10007315_31770 [Gemmobacter tilapiae]
MLAAIETMAQAHAIGLALGEEADLAAETAAGVLGHFGALGWRLRRHCGEVPSRGKPPTYAWRKR